MNLYNHENIINKQDEEIVKKYKEMINYFKTIPLNNNKNDIDNNVIDKIEPSIKNQL